MGRAKAMLVFVLGLLAVAPAVAQTTPNRWYGCVGHAPTCTMLKDLYNACNLASWNPAPRERWGRVGDASVNSPTVYCHWRGITCNSDQQLVKIDLSEFSEGMVCSELPSSLAPTPPNTREHWFSLRIPGATVTKAVPARVCNEVGGNEVKQLCHTRRWGVFWRGERASQTGGVHREGLPQHGHEIDTHWHSHWAGHWSTHWKEYWARFWHLKYTANATNGRGAEADAMRDSITAPMKRWSATSGGLGAPPHIQNPRDPNKFGWSGPNMGIPFGIAPDSAPAAAPHVDRIKVATICINTQGAKTAAQAVAACAPLAHLDLRASDDNAQAIAYSETFNSRCTGSPPTCPTPEVKTADGYIGADRLWVSLKDASGSVNPAAPTSCATKSWMTPNENFHWRGCDEAFHAVCVAPVGMLESMIPSWHETVWASRGQSGSKLWNCRTASHSLPREQGECNGRSFCQPDAVTEP